MTLFRMDVSRETGEVWLYMESTCGLKPLISWPDMDGMKDFAEMLLDIYQRRNQKERITPDISDNILRQVLDSDVNLSSED